MSQFSLIYIGAAVVYPISIALSTPFFSFLSTLVNWLFLFFWHLFLPTLFCVFLRHQWQLPAYLLMITAYEFLLIANWFRYCDNIACWGPCRQDHKTKLSGYPGEYSHQLLYVVSPQKYAAWVRCALSYLASSWPMFPYDSHCINKIIHSHFIFRYKVADGFLG